MKYFLLAALACIALVARGDNFPERYKNFGQLIFTNLDSAPFPHPDRAKGHTYQKEFFSAEKNYSDNTVALFIPKNLDSAKPVDFVIHFHGWRGSVTNVLPKYELIDQLAASGREAILVVPQGPLNAPDSFGGKLEDVGGFDRFFTDVLKVVHAKKPLQNVQPRNIILSGHSGGYHVISSIVAHQDKFKIHEVWLFDALYGQTEKFMNWFNTQPDSRLINIYTEHGGTKQETENLMKDLREKKTPFISGNENSITSEALQTNRLIFIFSPLAHDEVIYKKSEFKNYLEAGIAP